MLGACWMAGAGGPAVAYGVAGAGCPAAGAAGDVAGNLGAVWFGLPFAAPGGVNQFGDPLAGDAVEVADGRPLASAFGGAAVP